MGATQHALQVSASPSLTCRRSHRRPVTKTDRGARGSDCLEEGPRIQLDPAFVRLRPGGDRLGKAVCSALERYGAIVIDNERMPCGSSSGTDAAGRRGRRGYRGCGTTRDYPDLDLPVDRMRAPSLALVGPLKPVQPGISATKSAPVATHSRVRPDRCGPSGRNHPSLATVNPVARDI